MLMIWMLESNFAGVHDTRQKNASPLTKHQSCARFLLAYLSKPFDVCSYFRSSIRVYLAIYKPLLVTEWSHEATY